MCVYVVVCVFVCGSVSVSLFASVMSDIICLGACVGVWHQSVGLCVSVCVCVVCMSASCVPVSVALCLCLAITRCLSWAQLSVVERGHGLRLLHLHLQLLMPQSSHLVAVDHCGGVIGRDDVVARDDVAAVGSSVGRAGQRATATDCRS